MKKELVHIFRQHVPPAAVDYCLKLWQDDPFHFKVTRKRVSKAGDYKYNPRQRFHTITINNDLNPYSFLITYVHEVAHLHNFKEHERKVLPHGEEWKLKFKSLLLPLLNNTVFPDNILSPLALHMKNPKASSYTDHRLTEALSMYDENSRGSTALSNLKYGDTFLLKQRLFKKETLRRTRVVCLEVKTGRKYLIPNIAKVEVLSQADPSLNQ